MARSSAPIGLLVAVPLALASPGARAGEDRLGEAAAWVGEQEAKRAPGYLAWLRAVGSAGLEPTEDQLQNMMLGAGRRLQTRIAAVEHCRSHPHPALAASLFRAFARARFGVLPEDPDVFERALRALEQLPVEDQARGLREGLAPELAELAWQEQKARWLGPAAEGRAPEVRAALLETPSRWSDVEAETAAALVAAWEAHGPALVRAMSTEGGSVANAAAAHAADAVMAGLIREAPPEALALLAGVANDQGGLGRRTRAAREARALESPALAAALLAGPIPPPLPPVAPPVVAPGRTPGLEPVPPRRPNRDFVTPGDGPHAPFRRDGLPWALGAGAVLVAGAWMGARSLSRTQRAFAGLVVGSSALLLAEGLGRLAGLPRLADERPLFSFIDPGATVLSVPPTGDPGWRQTGGGSIRAWLGPAQPDDEVHRVAILGASSAHGSHYLSEETFASGIQAAADGALGPGRVEVLDLGVGGATSATVRAAGESALGLGADQLVVYYGHNEVAQFVRLGRYPGMDPDRVRLRMALHRSILYSALARSLGTAPAGGTGVAATEATTRADVDALKRLAVAHHRWNLEALLRAASVREVEVVLVEVATNYRFAHLEPHAQPGSGGTEDLRSLLRTAEAHAAAGRREEARATWQTAIDRSAWPREVTSEINATTRSLAEEYGCARLDAPGLFATRSPDGLAVSGLFWDDLHPTRDGHALLADALAPLVIEAARR